MREKLLVRRVKDYGLKEHMSIGELIDRMECSGGFTAKNLAEAVRILVDVLRDDGYTLLFSFPACIVATGLRGVIADFIGRGYVDGIVTTGGTIDHDIARAYGEYYHGSFDLDDVLLSKLNIHRLGNLLIPMENYGLSIESKIMRILDELSSVKDRWSVRELCWEIGRRIEDENSILRALYLRKIPLYSLGVLDSCFGFQLFLHSRRRRFDVDFWSDMNSLLNQIYDAEKLAALIVGGGISKHTVIWYSQFRGGLDKAIYITTAVEYDGSLSGARPREAISWGKLKPEADYAVVDGEATVILPILLLAVYEKIGDR
ncbi:MAG: deoxyhypusine synthase [Nitrososphaerota archaeon]|nr:deoxyhypusine synthase [Candidatus Bathyarchaeota archaeon]MDW8061092.1 deoxyhypusine synthase [Nitrososphaerota archaeon]